MPVIKGRGVEARRLALAPGLLGVIVALLGIIAIGSEFFFIVRLVLTVIALIIGWFTFQSRQWWWLPLPILIAVTWNPVVPFVLDDPLWLALHYLAAAGFIVVGVAVKVAEDPPAGQSGGGRPYEPRRARIRPRRGTGIVGRSRSR